MAAYRLDFARGRFDTFVPRAPSVANSFELVSDGDLLLDLATARSETYPIPAENPRVSPGTLEDDLARRDFSTARPARVLIR